MSGILTPVTNNYTVGKGLVFFDQFAPGTYNKQGERFFGDCKGLNVAVKSTQLDHYQSTGGVKVLDQSATIQGDASGQLMTEQNSPENMALFFFGTPSTVAQTAATVANEVIASATPGLYYQLGATVAQPMGVQNLNSGTPAVVKDSAAVTTYVAGTDYAIDYPTGRIQVLVGGAITAGQGLKVTYTTLATSKSRIISGTTPIEGALRFVPVNVTGTQRGLYMPWVKLIPNSSYELIGDKFIEMTFDLKVLSLAGASFVYAQDQ